MNKPVECLNLTPYQLACAISQYQTAYKLDSGLTQMDLEALAARMLASIRDGEPTSKLARERGRYESAK